jgi:hypothetical protein
MHRNHLNIHDIVHESTRSGLSEEIKIIRAKKEIPPAMLEKIEENYKALVPTYLMKEILHRAGCEVTTRCLANVRRQQKIHRPGKEANAIVGEVS